MFGLCIAEPYYRLGIFRVEYFSSEAARDHFRSTKVDGRTTTWILGEPMPEWKEYGKIY